ncbi:hypothetical protein KP509_23G017200 [Ceratopteris richardii]|uniref:protein-L-isoaspartate(D-aspartate) O-methyltransferase n=1 Tax=Ceratopteris richardii TaxID=49495 RepID=A0A8T2RY39_CERRI|nr:hypothetical protein KP509_23G017200 [Ceratopteris richardii]
MSWTCHGQNNADMVDNLQKNNILTSTVAAEAMKQIDRADFVLPDTPAYVDSPQPIGHGATISAPHMHGYCLSLLSDYLKPGSAVLDVGSGSGYLTAVFALMVGENGRAVGVEHIPELVERSIQSIKKGNAAHLLETGRLSVHEGHMDKSFQTGNWLPLTRRLSSDGKLGYPDAAPYDAIHVGAAAAVVPDALVSQLKPGGRMVIPVGQFMQDLIVIDKKSDGSLKQHSEMGVRYVPLV